MNDWTSNMPKKGEKTRLEERFSDLWTKLFPAMPFEEQARLIPGRRFKHDFVFREAKVAIEIQGAIFVKGGHSTGKGITRDYTKTLLALQAGYSTIHLSSNMITIENMMIIHEVLKERMGLNNAF